MQFTWRFEQTESIHLKNFLHQHGVSHRLFLKLRNQKQIQVNQHSQTQNCLLKNNDLVTITLPDELADPEVATSNEQIDIVYEDANWLIVNKPAGLTSVPGPTNQTDTLVNRVKGYLIETNSPNQRPHLITRLDRYTSGLLLIAKHQLANSVAVQMNQKKLLDKQYLAIVSGKLSKSHGIIDQPIGRIDDAIARKVTPDGQTAITECWVIEAHVDYSVVRLKLQTGRTHQIRVHMQSIGHPLVGDQLYGGPQLRNLEHQALDAHWLNFVDPFTNEEHRFKTKLPKTISQFIETTVK